MSHEVTQTRTVHDGAIITVRVDTVAMPDGTTSEREVVGHADSVAIVARDAEGRVLLITQYRHPLRGELVEIPAGLRDRDGEPPLGTAQRELREETGVSASTWTELVRLHTSPGILTEAATIYLAEDLTLGETEPDGAEEDGITTEWVSLADAVRRVQDGRITDAMAVAGLLALAVRGTSGG